MDSYAAGFSSCTPLQARDALHLGSRRIKRADIVEAGRLINKDDPRLGCGNTMAEKPAHTDTQQ